MTLRGKVQGGVIVLEGDEELPEGLMVEIRVAQDSVPESPEYVSQGRTLNERYAAVIGIAHDLPSDMALNHDHYLYGCPKK